MKITDDVRKYAEERGYGDADGETVLKARALRGLPVVLCKVEGPKGVEGFQKVLARVRGGFLPCNLHLVCRSQVPSALKLPAELFREVAAGESLKPHHRLTWPGARKP